ncbi:hypothetical protein [Clostridium sp. DMHC 10]|uniref:hypothetical protein n=1 Tax=Clostridium sp. DMHC 10 TaxID=747377 RepID=UPI0018DCB2AD|nr:hypothetical protein [Clostridium sp. DMHC 10]
MKIKLEARKILLNMKNKIENLKSMSNKIADMLILLAFFIVGKNTLDINIHAGFYVVAIELIIVSYFVSKE